MFAKFPQKGSSKKPKPWLALCVTGALVIGAGGLLPSLLGGDALARGTNLSEAPGGLLPAAMLGRLAAGTLVVLALCAGSLPLLRRWLAPGSPARPGGEFEVVASLPLGGRCCVWLVRTGEHYLLAGADGSGVQALVPVGGVVMEEGTAAAARPPARAPRARIEPVRVGAA
jgi:hypothetical protein